MYQTAVNIIPINRKVSPVIIMHPLPDLFLFPSFRSRYAAYVSCFALPIGINVRNAFLRTNPIPIKAPSPLMNIIPANRISINPDTENPSDKICMFTAMLSVKKPFIQNTTNVIREAMTKQVIYFINKAIPF